MKTALITGATDGIGKNLAFELAKRHYTIHVLGLGKEKGTQVINELRRINPTGNHQLFIVDLSTVETVNAFIDSYNKTYEHLDMLILNANATTFKEVKLNKDGIDMAFMIGYLSRYMFSVGLNDLLKRSDDGEIIHIGGATMVSPIQYNKLTAPDYSTLKSTAMGFMASNLLVQFTNQEGLTDVPYRFFEPGIVNTATVKSQNLLTRLISKAMGMIEPEDSARYLMTSIFDKDPQPGTFYSKAKRREPKKIVNEGLSDFNALISFSEEATGRKF